MASQLALVKGELMWGYRRKVLTSLMDPERGAEVAVSDTLGSGDLYTDVNNTVISGLEVAAGEQSRL